MFMFSTKRDTVASAMIPVAVILLFVGACQCAVDFNERPRNFSIELLYFTQAETDGHVVISPFGIWTLMTGIALGATENSYEELSRTFILPRDPNALILGYKSLVSQVLDPPSSSGVSLTSRNFVFVDNDFTVNENFKRIQKEFGASLKTLDFDDPNSARVANTYIEKSGGRVSNVLRSDDFEESRMLLTNVISFKGLWRSPFNTSDTALEPFYNEDKVVIGSVNMMYQKSEVPFSNMKDLKAFVIELPYGSMDKYSMLLILPYPSQKILNMYRKLDQISLKAIFDKLKKDEDLYGLADIDIKLPRFHITTNLALNKPLNHMGVFDIFQPDRASFKRVSKENIFVSAIVHKAEIEVTESGTVAQASTTATFADRISSPAFYCNRPFLYFVMEKSTTTVIFSGIYSKPSVY